MPKLSIQKWFSKREKEKSRNGQTKGQKLDLPSDLWTKCPKCDTAIYNKDLETNLKVCTKCDYHFRISASERISYILDEGSFEEFDPAIRPKDFLGFNDSQPYARRIDSARLKSGLNDAIVTGKGKINNQEVAVGVMDFSYMGGSMGSAVGEKITRMIEKAIENNLPVIVFSSSGGARMQEGIMSLMQMAKTSSALGRLREHSLPYISVLADPTTGGTSASYAMLGDINIAEPKALIGFAGPRVIEQTIRQKLPPGFQRSEYLLLHGMIDTIVQRKELKETLGRILSFFNPSTGVGARSSGLGARSSGQEIKTLLEFEKPLRELYKKIDQLKKVSASGKMDMSEEIKMLEKRIENTRRELFSKLTPIQTTQVARHISRPTTLDYIEHIFDDFIELHGDRNFADDPAMAGGLAKLGGLSCVVIGQQKGKNTKENLTRNFGMAHPEGYRKALRLMRLADRFGKPIIAFIDTPGAYPGIGAEERGQAEAIAKNLRAMSELSVPFIAIITGEGGSGGALGIGMGNRVLMLENAVYSVISPEGCASILFRDAARANEAAQNLKIVAKDLLEMEVIDEIIKEPLGGAHQNPKQTSVNIKTAILKHLDNLTKLSPRELVADRYNKYRKMGIFVESE